MAGKEQSGMEFADPELFRGAAWFFTPVADQYPDEGLQGEFLEWVEHTGARIASLEAQQHDELCAWISHVPQLISTALAAALVEEYGPEAPLLEAGGRALREMTRIAASPYSMWRDIAITNKKNIARRPAESRAASGAHPRKSGHQGTRAGIRASPPPKEKPQEELRHRIIESSGHCKNESMARCFNDSIPLFRLQSLRDEQSCSERRRGRTRCL